MKKMLDKEESYGDAEIFSYEEEDVKDLKGVLPLWSILPSYEMYSRQFYGEDGPDPPSYENSNSSVSEIITTNLPSTSSVMTPFNASETTSEYSIDQQFTSNIGAFGSFARQNFGLQGVDANRVTINDNSHAWQNNVLDNIHKLNDMTNSDNEDSASLDIKTFFTKDVCRIDEDPELIDPSRYEYKEGQAINGYITIENTGDKAIEFKMLYILFEGTITTSKVKKNFLQMYEFTGSFYKGKNVGRLITEPDKSDICCLRLDYQGYSLGFRTNLIEPRSKHKRFFSFQIPQHLLDNECPDYVLSSHVRLPPSLGALDGILEFNHVNTTIDYNVICRFIGKAKTYGYNPSKENALVFNESGDEYVILKQSKSPIRIIQEAPIQDPAIKIHQNLYYNNFIKTIDEKIKLGKRLANLLRDKEYHQIEDLVENIEQSMNHCEATKAHQLYVPSSDCKNPSPKMINVLISQKNALFKKKKGLFLSTPDVIYTIPYVSPKRFRSGNSLANLKRSIPFSLTSFSDSPPSFKSVTVDLVCLTVKSDIPIPIEFNHDILFKNNRPNDIFIKDHDNITTNVIDLFTEKLNQFKNISREVDISNLKIEKRFLDSIKCMASLKEKTINLSVNNPTIIQNQKSVDTLSWTKGQEIFHADFKLNLDFHNLCKKFQSDSSMFDGFTLVPEFQSCYISRIYYLKVLFHFSNDHILVKIPFSIINS